MSGGWIGVDLDGTLAVYDQWRGAHHIGEPVPAMIERVRAWIAEGQEVRIFTARVCDNPHLPEAAGIAHRAIQLWLVKHGLIIEGGPLPITNVKDYEMLELWDDRAVQVEQNTGLAYVHPHGRPTP